MKTKAQLRIDMQNLRNSLKQYEKSGLDHQIHKTLFHSDLYQRCNYLLTYVSFRNEVDTVSILTQGLYDGKRVLTPRVENREMNFYEIFSYNDLRESSYGIPEPFHTDQEPFKGADSKEEAILMIVPGLCFDREGNRIGYGAGYYDKYFSLHKDIHFMKTAVAYDFQIIEQIPKDGYDIRVDRIITPTQMINCKPFIQY